MQVLRFGAAMAFGIVVLSATVEAQTIRSLTPPAGRPEQRKVTIPRRYMPPKGLCRIWIDSVPANQQPAPTDCATAIRNKPQNGQVIFAEEDKDGGKDGDRRGKEKPKKPRE